MSGAKARHSEPPSSGNPPPTASHNSFALPPWSMSPTLPKMPRCNKGSEVIERLLDARHLERLPLTPTPSQPCSQPQNGT